MSIIYVLIPIAMLFVIIAVSIFFWAVKSEQFDDLDRQSVSILFDEDDAIADKSVNKTIIVDGNSDNDSMIDASVISHSSNNKSESTDVNFASSNDHVEPVSSSIPHIKPE